MTDSTVLHFPTVIDATMRRDFVACATKFWYSYGRQIALEGRPSIDLWAGAAYAKGCEATRKAAFDGGLSDKDAVAEGALALIKYWGDMPDDPDSPKSLQRMLAALDYYFEMYPPSKDSIRPYRLPNGKLATEITFCLPIPGTKHPETGEEVMYSGRFDMVGIQEDVLWGVDEKTSKALGATWPRKWTLRSQFVGYTWGAHSFNLPIAGFIIRGIAILKTQFNHAQAIVYNPSWKIERWLDQLREDVEDMTHQWLRGRWRMNLDDSCTSYSGCPFFRLCDSKEPESLIPVYYTHREWDPLGPPDVD